MDVAFQYWVMSQAHPEWTVTPWLMLVDKDATATVDGQPSDEDLRQIFAYNQLFETGKGILLYPSAGFDVGTDDMKLAAMSETAGDSLGDYTGFSSFGVQGRYLTLRGGSCTVVHLNILNEKRRLHGFLRHNLGKY